MDEKKKDIGPKYKTAESAIVMMRLKTLFNGLHELTRQYVDRGFDKLQGGAEVAKSLQEFDDMTKPYREENEEYPESIADEVMERAASIGKLLALQKAEYLVGEYVKLHPECRKDYDELGRYLIEEYSAHLERMFSGNSSDGTEYTWNQLVSGARKMRSKALPRVMSNIPASVGYPIDKINANIWDPLTGLPKNNNGQIAFATEKQGSKKEATILFSIDYDGLEKSDNLRITKQLTPFDKLVYIAVYALFQKNGAYMSMGLIYSQMGNKGKPNTKDIQKISDSVTKMGMGRIFLDNTQEVQTNTGYARFRYNGPLLAFESVEAFINNSLCENALHLLGDNPLPLMTFAQERKQVTTIPRALLETSMPKTNANLRIMDYLIRRIARMKSKRSKSSHKILYATLYEKCKITTRMQKRRAPKKIQNILDSCKSHGQIKDYKAEEDKSGVVIEL